MTTKLIIYTEASGRLGVTVPAPNAQKENESETAWVERIQLKDVPASSFPTSQIVDITDIPFTRVFRDAWEAGEARVDVSLPKARTIHMGRIRVARDTELAAEDTESLKAIEAGDNDKKAQVASRKQALRDIPQTANLDQYVTPETLDAYWPAELKPRE